jgi:hypothetical protein
LNTEADAWPPANGGTPSRSICKDRVDAVDIDDADGAKADSTAAELSRLRNEVIEQARELAIIRWEISSLIRQHPISGRVTQAKYSALRRFPGYANRIAQIRRAASGLLGSMRRQQRAGPTTASAAGTGAPGSLPGPVLLIGDSSIAQQVLSATSAHEAVLLDHGAGFTRTFSVPQANEPPLRAPDEGSFVKWLTEDARRLKKFGTIIVDAGDDVSLGLLRGRLAESQTLVLTSSTDESSSSQLVAELGRPVVQDGRVSRYANLPPAWIDPLDEDGLPIPAIAGSRAWPKISVVLVSFNQAIFLEEGLRSVLDQGYPNLEFIAIDGNSTDGSVEILERYRARLSDLVIEPDRGQSDGLNKGFARTTGDILTWVNSDDLLEPGALFRVAQAFTPGVDMVAGGCRQIGLSRDKILLNHHNRLPFGKPVALPLGLLLDVNRFWFTGSFFYQPEVFFSRDIWKRSGGTLRTDLNYVLDYDLWVRMAAAGATMVHIPEFLACSRTHDQQKTTVGMPNMPEFQWLLREYSSRLAGPRP